jgi:hypothetical protein
MNWATYFPANCPPDTATTGTFTVYRFLEGAPISSADFLTVREKAIDRRFSEPEKECRACSLSVFTDLEAVLSLQRRVPRWRKAVTIGHLDETSGKLKHTPSPHTNNSHHSWWVPQDIRAIELFSEVLEVPSEK